MVDLKTVIVQFLDHFNILLYSLFYKDIFLRIIKFTSKGFMKCRLPADTNKLEFKIRITFLIEIVGKVVVIVFKELSLNI